jgi:hypothetical protein
MIDNNKLKFYSPFHSNYQFKWVYLAVFIMFLPSAYLNPISMLGLYPFFILLKVMDWFEIIVKIRDSKRYIDWIDDLEKFKYIILSKYLFLVTVIVIFIYEFYLIFTKDSLFTVILSLIYVLMVILLSSNFYKNVLKLKK